MGKLRASLNTYTVGEGVGGCGGKGNPLEKNKPNLKPQQELYQSWARAESQGECTCHKLCAGMRSHFTKPTGTKTMSHLTHITTRDRDVTPLTES